MSSSGSVNNTAPVTQRAKQAYRNQLKQLQTADSVFMTRGPGAP